jgi:hypothetical protein
MKYIVNDSFTLDTNGATRVAGGAAWVDHEYDRQVVTETTLFLKAGLYFAIDFVEQTYTTHPDDHIDIRRTVVSRQWHVFNDEFEARDFCKERKLTLWRDFELIGETRAALEAMTAGSRPSPVRPAGSP